MIAWDQTGTIPIETEQTVDMELLGTGPGVYKGPIQNGPKLIQKDPKLDLPKSSSSYY